MAWLTTKYNTAALLVFTDFIVLVGGTYMIQYTTEAGTWQFMVGYLISQLLDASNFVFTQTMMMSKLKA